MFPSGWTSLSTGCYRIEPGDTYDKAAQACEAKGGYLVEINDENEQNVLKKFYFQDKNKKSGTGFWLGLTDRTKEGDWIWGHSGKEISYIGWNDGKANNENKDTSIAGFNLYPGINLFRWFIVDGSFENSWALCEGRLT